jgi:hypothetical protein
MPACRALYTADAPAASNASNAMTAVAQSAQLHR